MPAFSNNTSIRGSFDARSANALMEANDARSISQTSQTSVLPVVSSIDCLAFSPAATLRTARMTFLALQRQKCRAASSPSPTLDPVTIMVWSVKDAVGYSGFTNNWEYIKLFMS